MHVFATTTAEQFLELGKVAAMVEAELAHSHSGGASQVRNLGA